MADSRNTFDTDDYGWDAGEGGRDPQRRARAPEDLEKTQVRQRPLRVPTSNDSDYAAEPRRTRQQQDRRRQAGSGQTRQRTGSQQGRRQASQGAQATQRRAQRPAGGQGNPTADQRREPQRRQRPAAAQQGQRRAPQPQRAQGGQARPAGARQGQRASQQGQPQQRRRPQQSRPANAQGRRQPRPAGQGSHRKAGNAKGGRSGFPIGLFAVVAAVIVAVLAVFSVVKCSSNRGQEATLGSAAQSALAGSGEVSAGGASTGSATTEASAFVADGNYYVEACSAKSVMMTLDAIGTGNDGYTTVVVSEEIDTPNQQVVLKNNADGKTCTLITETGLALDCGDTSAGAGNGVYAMKPSGADSQNWLLVPVKGSDGSVDGYLLETADGAYAIQVGETTDGSAVTLEEADPTNVSQKFRFVPKDTVTSTLGQTAKSDFGDGGDSGQSSDGTDYSGDTDYSESSDYSDGSDYSDYSSEDAGYSDASSDSYDA